MPIFLAPIISALGLGTASGVIGGLLSNPIGVAGNRLFPVIPPASQQLVVLRMREEITQAEYIEAMRDNGFDETQADRIFRALQFFPSPSDVVTFMGREVFEEQQVQDFGLDDGFDALDKSIAAKAGMSPERLKEFWRAHWVHPPFSQVAEMLHRDILETVEAREQTVPGSQEWEELRQREADILFRWYGLIEIPPFWRDKLTRLSNSLITRVDLRRMYDMRLIDEQRLDRGHLDLGYSLEDAQALTAFTRVNEDFPLLMRRYENLWITRDELKAELVKIGLPEERAEEFIESRIDNLARPQRVAVERDLTKSEIINGVKKGLITFADGIALLEQMGYDNDEAKFVLNIQVEAGTSPETKGEFEQIVQGYRKSIGKPSQSINPRVIEIEKRLKEIKAALSEMGEGAASTVEGLNLTAEQQRLETELRVLRAATG